MERRRTSQNVVRFFVYLYHYDKKKIYYDKKKKAHANDVNNENTGEMNNQKKLALRRVILIIPF